MVTLLVQRVFYRVYLIIVARILLFNRRLELLHLVDPAEGIDNRSHWLEIIVFLTAQDTIILFLIRSPHFQSAYLQCILQTVPHCVGLLLSLVYVS